MKCVLVTGGAGFLGSHLCDRLIESGNYVICLIPHVFLPPERQFFYRFEGKYSAFGR